VEVPAPQPGIYYIEVRKPNSGSGGFSLLASVRAAEAATPGQSINGSLFGSGDVRYFQFFSEDEEDLCFRIPACR
jgi:hypothetical protein